MTDPAYDLDAVRRRIPILASHVPMSNCSQAPQSEPTREAAERYLTSWNEAGMDWESWIAETEAARAEFAAVIGARPEDVAVGTSVSQVTASVATAFDWTSERNRVIASAAEFPTVGHVWLAQERFGARVEWVPEQDGVIELSRYAECIDERTRVVAACHGCYQTGFKQDISGIAELAHAQGALLFVDAYQTLGTEAFDAPASGADFVASGNLKFLMGTPGIAFLWARPGLAEHLRPAITGWFGRADPFAFDATRLDWGTGARSFDLGTPPIMEAYVARAGMAWLREIGLEAIGAWNAVLGRRCVEGALERGLDVLGPHDQERRTPTTAIVCIDGPGVEAALRREAILASARGPVIRLAPHFYSTLEDVDRSLDALVRVLDVRRA